MTSKDIRVPEGYKKTELGIVPEQWEITKQGDIVTFYNGRAYKLSEWEKEGTPVIRLQNLTGTGSEYYYSNLKLPSKQYVDHGDLLYMWSGSFGPHIWKGSRAIYHYHIWRIECGERADKLFMYYLLHNVTDVMKSKMHGMAILHITKSGMENQKIPLPPILEQQKIASILSKVDEQIEQTEQIIEKTELLKKGMMQKIFVHGTTNQKLKEIDVKYSPKKWTIPENWNTKLFNEITFQITDGTHFTPNYIEKGIPFLRVTDIQSDSIDWNSVKYIPEEEHKELIKRCKPEKGDILLSKNGTIGIPKIIDWDQEFSIFVSLCLIKANTNIVNVKYLYHLLNSDIIRNQYSLRAKTGTVTNLHLEEIRELTVPVPPLEEQIEISNIMDSFDNELKHEHKYLIKLQELKKGLMQDLLTGKVRVCV